MNSVKILYGWLKIQRVTMGAKQQKAIARNSRLNYLIDSGVSAMDIKMDLKSLNLKFIERIIQKRALK